MLSVGGLAVLGALSWGLWCLVRWWRRVKAVVDEIQGPRAFPLVGNVHQFRPGAEDFFEQACGTTAMFDSPRLLRIWMTVLPYVMVYGAEEAEAVLSSAKNLNKAREYGMIQPWLGLGLLTAPAAKWRPRRKLLTPTFHQDILRDYVEVFVAQSQTLLRKLALASAGGRPVDVSNFVTLCALDIICETAMGKDLGAQDRRDSDYVRAVYQINDIIQERQKKPWLWPDLLFRLLGRGREHAWCLRVLHGFTEEVIRDRAAQRKAKTGQEKAGEATGRRRLAFLDLLLEMVEAGSLPMEDVRSEVDTFMFEGHDTTSAGLNWALHLLANAPEAQAKVQAEVDGVFEGLGEAGLGFEELKELRYVECVVKESLRLFPSVPIVGRRLDEECVVGGVRVPAGVQVLVLPYAVHRDPRHWADPEAFRPERFLPEASRGRHPYAFLPFSAGARNCIGQRFALMEEKAVLALLCRHFSFTSLHRRDQVRPTAKLILRPTQGVHLRLTPRHPLTN